jgi:hypothetical protein
MKQREEAKKREIERVIQEYEEKQRKKKEKRKAKDDAKDKEGEKDKKKAEADEDSKAEKERDEKVSLGTYYSFGLLTFMKIKSIEDAATPSISTDLPRVYALHR